MNMSEVSEIIDAVTIPSDKLVEEESVENPSTVCPICGEKVYTSGRCTSCPSCGWSTCSI